tara:strand:- start:5722 stop:7539 length:1818 start_codon:yes stop_codon:yes gene_type:complete
MPPFLIGLAIIAASASNSGGGGGGGGADAPVPENFNTWRAENAEDSSFNDAYDRYQAHLGDEKFGLSEDARAGYLPESVVSGYTDERFANDSDMRTGDRAAYSTAASGVRDFDTWLSGNDTLADSTYAEQHRAYKSHVNGELRRPEWMAADDADIRTFSAYDPGMYMVEDGFSVVDDGQGSFAGAYRSEEDFASQYNTRVGAYLTDNGYGNLITDPDNMTRTDYFNAYNEANARMPFRDQITGLGYGDTFDNGTSSRDLESLWADVQERDRYKGLLDEMGYEYDPNDNATGLGLMYGQANAIEDVRSRLEESRNQYSGLEDTYASALGDMESTQGQFDSLFADYGSLNTNYGDLQGTYDSLTSDYGALEGTYNTTRDQLGQTAGEYDELSGLYDTLTSNYGTVSDDYNAAVGSLGDLQGNYDELFGDYGTLTADRNEMQGRYDELTNTQATTLADLQDAQSQAQDYRGQLRANETSQFLEGTARDRTRRIGSGIGQVQAPTQPEYTQAMDALGSTALEAGSYQMAPIDFTSGFDPGVFDPMALSNPADYGATDYTNLAAPTQMGLPQQTMDFGQPFNPYFEALNQQYGVNIPASNYGLPAIGGTK